MQEQAEGKETVMVKVTDEQQQTAENAPKTSDPRDKAALGREQRAKAIREKHRRIFGRETGMDDEAILEIADRMPDVTENEIAREVHRQERSGDAA